MRSLLKWIALFILFTFVIATVASRWWGISARYVGEEWAFRLLIGRGLVIIQQIDRTRTAWSQGWSAEVTQLDPSKHLVAYMNPRGFYRTAYGRLFAEPAWIPLVLAGTTTVWLWWLDRRRPAPGKCRCGYDLTGNTSGRCPECGLMVTVAVRRARHERNTKEKKARSG